MQHFYSNCTTVLSSLRTRTVSKYVGIRTLSLLFLLTFAMSISATEVVLFEGFTEAKNANYFKEYTLENTAKVTATTPVNIASSSGDYYVLLGSTPSNGTVGSNYVGVKSSLSIKTVSFLLTANGKNKTLQPVLVGWKQEAVDKKSDIALSNLSVTSVNKGKDNAQWLTYDLSGKGIKEVRLYRAIKGLDAGDGVDDTRGNGQTLQVYGIKLEIDNGSTTYYTVSFNTNNHGDAIDNQTIESGKYATEPTAPTADGYTFGGWYTDNETFKNKWNFTTDKVTKGTTLFAKWTAIPPAATYKVTFAANGHGTAPAELTGVASGSTISEPTPAPTATDGYTFDGWYKEAACTTPWNFATDKVTDNITLYAKWVARKYAFGCYVFEDSETIGTNPKQTAGNFSAPFYIDNISFSAMNVVYEKEGTGDPGYGGWKIKTKNAQISFYVENDSKVLLQSGAYGTNQQFTITYTDATTDKETSTTVVANTTIEVTVKADTKVTITTANTTNTATLKRLCISANENTVYLRPTNLWAADGARFAAYYWVGEDNHWIDLTLASDCEAVYTAQIPAQYSNIIFCRMKAGATENNWDNKWNQTADLTVQNNGVYTISSSDGAGSWTQYTPATYSVSFDANDGTGTMTAVSGIACGGSATLTANAFTRENYTFIGWNTQPDGNGTAYADKAELTDIKGKIILYAQWQAEEKWSLYGNFTGKWLDNYFQNGKVELHLEAGKTYEFKIRKQVGATDTGYGNSGTMTSANCTKWDFGSDNNDNAKITTTNAGTYIFTLNNTTPNISVTYPAVYTIQYAEGKPDEISGSTSLTVQGVPTITQQVAAGDALTLPTAADIKIAAGSTTVYQFNGWSDGTHTYPADQTTIDNISSDLTLTALWTPVVFHIYYWDGQNEDNTQNTAINGLTPTTYTYESKETLPTDAGVITKAAGKTDVIFKNWKVRDWGQTAFTLKDLDYATPYRLSGDINLYAEWQETTGCTTIAKGTYVSSGNVLMTSEVGTITIENGSRNSGAIQLGDNTKAWIQIVPASGRVFLAGDKLSVTFYSSSAKQMGFKIMDEDGKITEERSKIEVPAKGTATDIYYLKEENIRKDGSIRIYRLNSDDRFYAIEVEQCQNVEMITATVQPGGGVIDESAALNYGWSKQVQSNGFIWYTKTVAKGSHITLPSATFVDNQFAGYQIPGDEAVYNADESYQINANTTFIAQWIPLTPTGKVKVTLDLNGGTFKNDADEALWTKEISTDGYYYMVIQEGYPLSLPELDSPTGKSFEGYLDQNSDRYEVNTPYNIYGNIDFVADWCFNKITLTWECDSWETDRTNTFVLNSVNRAVKDYPTLKITGTLPEGAEIKYSSSDPAVAIIHDNGEIVAYMAGETTITAMFDGEGDYCSAEASYTLIVECNEPTPVIEGVGDLSGCNTTITLRVRQKAADGTISDYPAEGFSFQWYKDDKAIEGATQVTYTVQTVGDYFVVVHDFCYAQSENTARITSSQAEPEVVRLAPFQFYRPGHTYPAEQATRHLFSYKSADADASKCALTAVRKRSGEQPADIAEADLQTFISVSATPDSRGHYTVTANLNSVPASLGLQAGDTLTLTLTPFDNCGSLSAAYAEQIDIRTVSKPALAFIISGADQLTRDKAKFTLHGDFLTGINRADLYQQSGKKWADTDLNTPLPLYTAIQEKFEVVPVNGYADFNLYNYEPFDILLLTDFVRTGIGSKGNTTVTVIDSLAKLVDYRPMFSLKAHMAKAEFPTWKTKGFIANPAKPAVNPQRDMTVLCLAHNIFEGLPEYHSAQGTAATEDDYNNKIIYNADGDIVVRITSEGGYDDSKALQGFESVDATNFVNIAIIPTGKNNGTLITCCERQANINARLLILSVNADATCKLTPIGCQAIIKGLNYLLETDPVKVSDCSVTFHNQDGKGDHLWTTPGNWSTGRLPLKEQNIQIAANCIVNTPDATAATIKIIADSTLTIQPKGALTVNGQIWTIPSKTDKHNTSEITDPSMITILSDASGVGALVRTAGDDARLAATVKMYSKAYFEWEDGKRKKYWQYVGIPIQTAAVPECFYGAYTYLWEEANGWTRKGDGTTLEQFKGYGLSVGNKENTQHTYTLRGDLATSVNRDITLTIDNANENYRGTNMIGNSWTAPIHIDKMLATDFGTANATVYIYNTGRDDQQTAATSTVTGDADATQPGQWVAITPGLAAQADYTGLKVIPAMQAFDILTESETSLYLDYERVVRGGGTTDINTPMRAPQSNKSGNGITLMRVTVADSQTHTDLYLMQHQAFTDAFDNGWDATYMACDGRSASLYAITPIGEMAVAAIPEIEGTNLGFARGKETEYTFSFGYTGSMLYLNDTRERRSTLITDWNTYRFTANDDDDANRFYISATPIEAQVPSGLVEVSDNHGLLTLSNPAHENLSICLYDAAGRLCATTSTTEAITDITLPATQGVYLLRVSGENTHIVRKLTR